MTGAVRSRKAAKVGNLKDSLRLRSLKGVIVTAAVLLCFIPIDYLLLMSCNAPHDILAREIFPSNLQLDNWTHTLQNTPILQFLRNSILSASLGTVIALLVALPTNYAISRLRVGGKNLLTI